MIVETERFRSVGISRQDTSFRHREKLIDRIKRKFLITPANIPEFVLPIADFINEAKPDYIIAIDRGGRLTALAAHILYQELYGALPTQDHVIHFRKMSHKIPYETMLEQFRADVQSMLSATEFPTVLVIDDYVNLGRTKSLVTKTLTGLSDGRINLFYGVMRGRKAEISADRNSLAGTSWRNRGDIIGIEYLEDSIVAQRIPSIKALSYRQQISRNVREYGRQIRDGNR